MANLNSNSDHFIVIICAFFCCITMIVATDFHMNTNETDDLPVAQPFVDILISKYFGVEQNLWQRIADRADNILLQVFKAHEKAFDDAIAHSGSGVLGSNLSGELIDIISNINGTSELGQMHLKEQIVDKQSIMEYATTGLKILKDASNLFDYTMKDHMWANLISVSIGILTGVGWSHIWYQLKNKCLFRFCPFSTVYSNFLLVIEMVTQFNHHIKWSMIFIETYNRVF